MNDRRVLLVTDAISTNRLTKRYGQARGIDDVSFTVAPGQAFGFLGPNGAGKTTTMRVLLGLLRPTSGAGTVLGFDPQTDATEIHRRIGYLPGEVALYPKLTGGEMLEFFGNMRGGVPEAKVTQLAERFQLDLKKRISEMSRGNKQKVGLIAAFMHEPDLVVLDEPTSGLDPIMQQEFQALTRETVATGRTVFLSSHVLPEVEHTCDRVAIIREGRLVAEENVATLKKRAVRRLRVTFADTVHEAEFQGVAGVKDVTVTDHTAECVVTGSVDAFLKAVAKHEVVDIATPETTLEEAFLSYYGGDAHDDDA